MKRLWIGIDTGGTFTDLVLVDIAAGEYRHHKLPTTTDDPSRGILTGIAEIVEQAGGQKSEVEFLVLGTTLATNAVLEGRTAPTGMLTTRGFRDVLELARQRRPHYFNLDVPKPVPAASRACRLEIAERIGCDGEELVPLPEDEVARAVQVLQAKGLESIAICYMHAYANPAHELRTAELVRAAWPGVYVCTSHEVLAEFREFERFATATVNASLMPIMDRYLERFERGVRVLGIAAVPRVMQSNGGAVSPGAVRRMPVNTFFSGPAGGVISTTGIGRHLAIPDLITFDMGGTSTDVCLIRALEPAKKSQREIGGFPVRTRTIDIHTIGAGGGSLAWVDAGGLLKVGPMSAGAVPGPAAYGRGGTRPTVTDANVVLGRLNPKTLLDGRMVVYPARARAAIENELCAKIGVDLFEAAAGILDIVNVNMMGAVRVISVEQGEDPRDFTLVAFGGAGPLHAADIARNMGIRKVLVPPRPGLLSAMGLLHADVRGDFSLTRLVRAEAQHLATLNGGFEHLRRQGEAWIAGEAPADARVVLEWSADLRYFGQNFELILGCTSGSLDEASLAALVAAFHARHEEHYGYDMAQQPVEIVNLRLAVTVAKPVPPHERAPGKGDVLRALAETRNVWFPETGFVSTPVYRRSLLPPGTAFDGPMLIEQMDSTTVVPPKAAMQVDAGGYIHLTIEPLVQKESSAWPATSTR